MNKRVIMMLSRVLRLKQSEEREFDFLMGQIINPLETITEMHVCSYREAYFIYKGKITPEWGESL